MARTLDAITTDIKVQIRTNASLNAFKFPEEGGSKVSVFNLFISTYAICMFTFETIMDQLKIDIQAIADSAPSGNAKWVQAQILKFQYGDVIQLVNFVPTYPVIDTTKQIITQCAVKDAGNGVITIKVAKGTVTPYSPLSAPELSALRDYYYGTSSSQGIGFAGVKAFFVSLNPDRLWVQANIFYLGQYGSTTVKAAVIAAINTYLGIFNQGNFDGRLYIIRLIDAIQAVPGVSRVVLTGLKGRAQTVAFGSGITIDFQGYYDTVAGHIISEDTGGQTLTDQITMTQEL